VVGYIHRIGPDGVLPRHRPQRPRRAISRSVWIPRASLTPSHGALLALLFLIQVRDHDGHKVKSAVDGAGQMCPTRRGQA
jgi:hypothetical protein